MRVEAGAVVDEFDLPRIGRVVARHTRVKTPEGVSWACLFTVTVDGHDDLSVVHRLSAPNFAESRRSVRYAVEFLAGSRGIAPPAGTGDRVSGPAPLRRSPAFTLPHDPDYTPTRV